MAKKTAETTVKHTTPAKKLAEALMERSAAVKKLESLKDRAATSAIYQEGSKPAEDLAALLAEHAEVLAEYETLVRQINITNAVTLMPDGTTLTAALARRDALKLEHGLYTSVANAAVGEDRYGWGARRTKSELKTLATIQVGELQKKADEAAKAHRELDVAIQQLNWSTDLKD